MKDISVQQTTAFPQIWFFLDEPLGTFLPVPSAQPGL